MKKNNFNPEVARLQSEKSLISAKLAEQQDESTRLKKEIEYQDWMIKHLIRFIKKEVPFWGLK